MTKLGAELAAFFKIQRALKQRSHDACKLARGGGLLSGTSRRAAFSCGFATAARH